MQHMLQQLKMLSTRTAVPVERWKIYKSKQTRQQRY